MDQDGYRPSEAMVDISLMVHLNIDGLYFWTIDWKMNDLCYIICIFDAKLLYKN